MHEVWADDILLTFDGRVLEVFGFPGEDSMRFHVLNLDLRVDGPDRKGRHAVKVKPATRGGGCAFDVPKEDWPQAEPLFDAVLAAMSD